MKAFIFLSVLIALMNSSTVKAVTMECQTEILDGENGDSVEYVVCDDGKAYAPTISTSNGVKLYAGRNRTLLIYNGKVIVVKN